jgi:hypothetical protein
MPVLTESIAGAIYIYVSRCKNKSPLESGEGEVEGINISPSSICPLLKAKQQSRRRVS